MDNPNTGILREGPSAANLNKDEQVKYAASSLSTLEQMTESIGNIIGSGNKPYYDKDHKLLWPAGRGITGFRTFSRWMGSQNARTTYDDLTTFVADVHKILTEMKTLSSDNNASNRARKKMIAELQKVRTVFSEKNCSQCLLDWKKTFKGEVDEKREDQKWKTMIEQLEVDIAKKNVDQWLPALTKDPKNVDENDRVFCKLLLQDVIEEIKDIFENQIQTLIDQINEEKRGHKKKKVLGNSTMIDPKKLAELKRKASEPKIQQSPPSRKGKEKVVYNEPLDIPLEPAVSIEIAPRVKRIPTKDDLVMPGADDDAPHIVSLKRRQAKQNFPGIYQEYLEAKKDLLDFDRNYQKKAEVILGKEALKLTPVEVDDPKNNPPPPPPPKSGVRKKSKAVKVDVAKMAKLRVLNNNLDELKRNCHETKAALFSHLFGKEWIRFDVDSLSDTDIQALYDQMIKQLDSCTVDLTRSISFSGLPKLDTTLYLHPHNKKRIQELEKNLKKFKGLTNKDSISKRNDRALRTYTTKQATCLNKLQEKTILRAEKKEVPSSLIEEIKELEKETANLKDQMERRNKQLEKLEREFKQAKSYFKGLYPNLSTESEIEKKVKDEIQDIKNKNPEPPKKAASQPALKKGRRASRPNDFRRNLRPAFKMPLLKKVENEGDLIVSKIHIILDHIRNTVAGAWKLRYTKSEDAGWNQKLASLKKSNTANAKLSIEIYEWVNSFFPGPNTDIVTSTKVGRNYNQHITDADIVEKFASHIARKVSNEELTAEEIIKLLKL